MPFDPLSPPNQDPAPRWERPGWFRLPPLSRLPRAGLSVGLAAGLALGGAGIAFAASSATSSPSTSTTVPGAFPKMPGRPHLPRGPFGPMGGARFGRLGDAVHGQVTVPNGSGGYRTIEMQVGKVDAVSSSSITVTSADGYRHTYRVAPSTIVDSQAGGIGAVAKGDQVRIIASSQSGTDTAMAVVDATKVGASWKGFGFGMPRGGYNQKSVSG
jgi:hypothetical protein